MTSGSAAPDPARFDIRPLLVANCTCTMAMMAFVSLIGPIARQLGLSASQAGAVITIGGVMWMLSAPRWGRQADRRGRRTVMLLAVSGFSVCYALLCALLIVSLSRGFDASVVFAGMLITRGAMGGFYSAVPAVGQALIADNVPAERRTATLALLGAANAVGLVTGPALAGGLAAIGLATPLYVTGLLPVVAMVVLWRTLPRSGGTSLAGRAALSFADRRLRRPMLVSFIAYFSVSIAQIIVGFFAIDRLGLAGSDAARVAGLSLTMVGVSLIGSQMIVRRLGWPPAKLVRRGAVIGAIGFAAIAASTSGAMLIGAYFVTAFGMGWVFPAFGAMAANAVQAHEQGAAAGVLGAAQGFGTVVGPFVGTLCYDIEPGAPYLLIVVLLVLMAAWPMPAAPRSRDRV
ncbi:MAG: MFS transporter [Burkholderiaceae bacterium]